VGRINKVEIIFGNVQMIQNISSIPKCQYYFYLKFEI
jgi:hypothetical protein